MLPKIGINIGLPMDDTGKNILHENKLENGLSSVSIEKDVDDWFIQSFGKEIANTFKKNWFLGVVGVICGTLAGNIAYYTIKATETRNEYDDIKNGIAEEYTSSTNNLTTENYKKEFYSDRYNAIGLARWFLENGIYDEYTKYQIWIPTKDVYCDTLCTLSYELAKNRFNSRMTNSISAISDSKISTIICSSFRNYFNFCMHKEGYHDPRLSFGDAGARPSNKGEDIYNIYAKICGNTEDKYKYTSFQDTHNNNDSINSTVYKYYTKDNFKSKIKELFSDDEYTRTIYENQLENFFSGYGSNFDLANLLANTYGTSNIRYNSIPTLPNILKYDLLIDDNKLLKNFGTTPAANVLDALLDHVNSSVTINMSVIMNMNSLEDTATDILNAVYEYKYPISGTLEELILPIVKLVVIAYINFLNDSSNTSSIFTETKIPSDIYSIYEIMFYIRHMFLENQIVVSAMTKNKYVRYLNGTDNNRLSNANPSLQSIESYISKFKVGSYTRNYLTNKGLHTYAINTMKEL